MQTIFSPELTAELTLDDGKRVRHIVHSEYFPSDAGNARAAAAEYLKEVARTLGIAPESLAHLHQWVSFVDPRPQDVQYRLSDVKKFFDSSTFCYYQTIHNTPVWDGGLTVDVKQNPLRIVSADHRGHPDLALRLPPADVIARVRDALVRVNVGRRDPRFVGEHTVEHTSTVAFREVFAGNPVDDGVHSEATRWLHDVRIKRGLFYVYRFDGRERQMGRDGEKAIEPGDAIAHEATAEVPMVRLPPLPPGIRNGEHYLVVEIVFELPRSPRKRLDWKALVEVETGAILWLRAMTASVNGLVFKYDPKTGTGDLTNTPDDGNAILNPLRSDAPLLDLDAPVSGTQSLSGSHVVIRDDDLPTIAPPTKPSATDFDFDARTNEFAAVNAYYHANNVFRVIEDLGFPLTTYFDGTTFPVHVDHRAHTSSTTGVEVNAFCNGDGASDGIGLVGYCLSDTTNPTNPLGRSVDKWVHWHEIGGHGTLFDHVNGGFLGFAHSAGDSLAAFQNDPESGLRSQPERFRYAPFVTPPAGINPRYFNRPVAGGWGWGGAQDTGGYDSEQILATTLFRIYQSIGGDSGDVAKRWHASRVATYLVLLAVGKLMPGANANSPMDFYNKLVAADADDWTTEGLAGGAYRKVIRWSFEKQGLFQAPGASKPTTQSGAPPDVDLYIDDGRGGEYQYEAVHWHNPSVWNRTAADGMTGEQPGVAGVESHAYVKVKNRGTTNAGGTVKIWHCVPGAGLTWPTDFVQAGPADGLPTGVVQANGANEVIVGPFAWTPNVNAYGHDCLLAIVETEQDPSNVNNFGPGETIAEWRLVPHDNNVGQRNVTLVPGGGGGGEFAAALDGAFFMAGNTFNKTARMELKIEMPKALAARGWALRFDGLATDTFRLKPGAKRRIDLRLARGSDFTAGDVRSAGPTMLGVHLYANGMLIGGMSYLLDPDMTKAAGTGRPDGHCNPAAQKLIDCLQVGGGQKVKRVCVKKIVLDIELENDCDCD